MARRRRLKAQLPDLADSLAVIQKLKEKKEMETQFLLSDQVYAKAKVPPTEKVNDAIDNGVCF